MPKYFFNIYHDEPEIDQDDEQAVLETLRSTWISTGGIAVDNFEREMAEFTGAKFTQ